MAQENRKSLRTGVFIDGSNLFWGSRRSGIEIDFEKLREYLKVRFDPVVFNYYACEDNDPRDPVALKRAYKRKKFLNFLEGIGYRVIRKGLKHLVGGVTKCDMDIELTMDMRNYEDDLDCIILFTGDSDFLSVVQYYWAKGKIIRIFSFGTGLSWELKTFALTHPGASYITIESIRDEVERRK